MRWSRGEDNAKTRWPRRPRAPKTRGPRRPRAPKVPGPSLALGAEPRGHSSETPLLEFPDIDRLVLERSRNASEAVRVMTDIISTYGQGECSTCHSSANYNDNFAETSPTS